MRCNRCFYAEPDDRASGGRPRCYGAKFAFRHPQTWWNPTLEWGTDDPQYGRIYVQAWPQMHAKLYEHATRGTHQPRPIIVGTLIAPFGSSRCGRSAIALGTTAQGRTVAVRWRIGPKLTQHPDTLVESLPALREGDPTGREIRRVGASGDPHQQPTAGQVIQRAQCFGGDDRLTQRRDQRGRGQPDATRPGADRGQTRQAVQPGGAKHDVVVGRYKRESELLVASHQSITDRKPGGFLQVEVSGWIRSGTCC